jgi:hypothetical protein
MLNLYWDGTRATGAMVQDLSHRPDWVEIPLPHTPHMRLFARKGR